MEHKKLHAQRSIRSTLWSTKSCTLSGARFGAQKVARSTTHPEHALEHKKLHAQRPIRSTLWSTKSCTLNDLSGARFAAQKIARSSIHPEHALEHKKLHAQRPIRSTLWSTKSCTLNDPSGARFGAQKVARSTTHPEHALEHKKLHVQRPIQSTETHLNALWFQMRQQPSHGWVCTSSRPLRGVFFFLSFSFSGINNFEEYSRIVGYTCNLLFKLSIANLVKWLH